MKVGKTVTDENRNVGEEMVVGLDNEDIIETVVDVSEEISADDVWITDVVSDRREEDEDWGGVDDVGLDAGDSEEYDGLNTGEDGGDDSVDEFDDINVDVEE